VTDLSGDEMATLFRQHLQFLREGRDAIVQINEQINRMERELGLFGGHARRGPEPETVL
jgi:hypothetical protein